ncbi:MAG: metallophosphoesterase [Spirochaetales bacterium]|nr:metallophosphoesterase [Spirochaetales bacterium]
MKIREIFNQTKTDRLKARIIDVFQKRNVPPGPEYIKVIEEANQVLASENNTIRPKDKKRLPGGIVFLKTDLPTVIVPDLHARVRFLVNLLSFTDSAGTSVLQKLAFNQIQVVCLGDGFHSEYGTRERWKAAYNEFCEKYHSRKHMDREMGNSMRLMEIVMLVKSAFPDNFHFLKGNHENIMNERDNGNHAFRKFAWESLMVYEYLKKFYDQKLLDEFSRFEKNLPLLAVGSHFLISHAEPKQYYKKEDITNFREHPEIIEGLTWTADDVAAKNSVDRMLKNFLPADGNISGKYYFGGHRSIRSLYNIRANGKFVQIHNPARYVIALIQPGREIDLEQDIMELDNKVNKTFSMKSFLNDNVVRKLLGLKLWKRK